MNIDFLTDFNIINQQQDDEKFYFELDCPVFRVNAEEMRETNINDFLNFSLMVSRAFGTILFHTPAEDEIKANYIAIKAWLPKGAKSFYFVRAGLDETKWTEVIVDMGNHICTSAIKGRPNIIDGKVESIDIVQTIPFSECGGEEN